MSLQNRVNGLKKCESLLFLSIFDVLENNEILTFLYFIKMYLLKFTLFSFIFSLFFFFLTQIFRLVKRCDYKNSAIVLIAITCVGYCFWCYRGNTSNYVKYYRRNLPELQLSTLVSTIQFSVGTTHTTHSWLYRLQSSRHMPVTGEQGMWKAEHYRPCDANYALLYQPWHSSWINQFNP